MLERRGFTTQLLSVSDTPPAVYGSLSVPGATRTVVFYAHYDGQPVTPADWTTPAWSPVLRSGTLEAGASEVPWSALPARISGEYRLYGRSTSDDKGPIVAFLAALDALKAAGQSPSVNVKVFLEGEEEAGSPNLERLLKTHRETLRADAWIFGDGPVHQSRQALVSFGVRGSLGLDITTYGPVRAVHSGHYGNWVPNPAVALVHLVASMRDTEGRILIKGFADAVTPLSSAERAAIAAAPDEDDAIAQALALGRRESVGPRLVDAITIPALNIRGFRAGEVGDTAANAVPTQAQVSIDFRLVPDLTPDLVRTLVERHIEAQGYHIVRTAPDAATRRAHPRLALIEWGPGYPGYRAPMDLPVSRAVIAIVGQVAGRRSRAHAEHGRQPAAVSLRRHPAGAHRVRAGRQPRQQPARRQREPAYPEPVGCDRDLRRAARASSAGVDRRRKVGAPRRGEAEPDRRPEGRRLHPASGCASYARR